MAEQENAAPAADNRGEVRPIMPPKPSPPTGLDFLGILARLNDGEGIQKFAEELAKVTKGVNESGRRGTLTVKINIEPVKNAPGVVTLEPMVSSSIPQPKMDRSIFYPDEVGNLHRNDPTQSRIPLEAYKKVE